jgi:acetyl esterase/lipase
MVTRTVVWVACVLAAVGVSAAEPPAGVEWTPDVTYATVEGEALKLNLARPKEPGAGAAARPLILVIHGGGWAAGDRKSHDAQTWEFVRRGYVSATVSYRFAPKHPFPAQVRDVKAAVRYLRANAERYGIDPRRIGAVGFSAGGHLSMMLGTMDKADGLDDSGGNETESSKVQAVVSFFGPADFTAEFPDRTKPILEKFLGGLPAAKPDAARAASPVTYVNAGDAPMLLFQGTKDALVPHEQATRMADALTRAGVPGRVELLLGANHGWGGAEMTRTAEGTMRFFAEHLRPEAAKK